MKKLLIFICMLGMTSIALGQAPDATYVIFTSIPEKSAEQYTLEESFADIQGIFRQNFQDGSSIFSVARRPFFYKDGFNPQAYIFRLDYELNWTHFSERDKENPYFQLMKTPFGFLDSIQPIDWDVIGPKLTKTEVEAIFEELKAKPYIYFIDRNDIRNDSLTLIPVRIPPPPKY